MDPPPDDEEYASSHLYRIDRDEDLVASYWRTHRKPATYSEEHTMGLQQEPFVRRQQRNNKIAPAISSARSSQFSPTHPNTAISSPPTSPFFSSDDMGSVSAPLKVWQKSSMRNPNVYSRSPGNPSPPASLEDMSRVERSALCFGGSLPKLGQKSHKRTKESRKGKGKDQDRSDVIIDTSGCSNNMPQNSLSSQETPPGSNKSIPSATNESINVTSDSTSFSCADNMADSCGSTQPQASGSTQPTSDFNGSGSGSGNGTLEHSKKQRPTIPRIIIPDGTSINLSTPPTTPRPQVRQIRPRQMPVPIWPSRFIQFRDRLKASRRMAFFKWSKPSVPTEQIAQGQNANPKEPEPTTAPTEAALAHPDTTAATNGDPALTHLGFSPAFGILGIPFYSTVPESETSSQKDIWWDYEDSDDEPSHGGWCSKERWRHVFCTGPGLTNTGKRLVTTTLGLVVILALALTALGRIRNQNQVSDVIPESLDGKVFEAQVMVIRDFQEQRANMTLEKRQGEASDERLKGTKIPFWEHTLRKGCFRELCEIEDTWNEFIAFMNPVSFGINLPQNWPSLCNSCIEISRNQFVYQTTVRVLGDLSQCDTTPPPPSSTVPTTPSPISASKIQPVVNTGRAPPPSSPIPHKNHGHRTRTSVRKPTISKSTSKPLFQTPDARKAALPKRQVEAAQETFPTLIVDPATFSNLTEYDSVNAIQSKEKLLVQFRFVLCDD
ncbi:hypothetical protein BGZ59_006040 [Podila verticillata]|nr:hypothetical protein BGZ59_006040 [Podila verticillata]KFH65328.1 hypothetical protein MVEG_08807 [Podila verticillata NRRL 6337]